MEELVFSFVQDLRYAIRTLLKAGVRDCPVLTLALGIGRMLPRSA